MNDGKRPLLLFPSPIQQERSRRRGGGAAYSFPPKSRQIERFGEQFASLASALSAQRAAVTANADFAEPEKVLVFEIAGSVDTFVRAVHKAGLEWLTDLRLEDLEPDDDFYVEDKEGKRREKTKLEGRLFLTMTDQRALEEMLSLWAMWETDQRLPRGYAPWGHVFAQLRTVRFWDSSDRLEGTGLQEDWQERLNLGQTVVPFEVELWYREDRTKRDLAEHHIERLIRGVGGGVSQTAMIEEIRYHAVAGTLPAENVDAFLGGIGSEANLVRCDDIMFFRPTGQAAFISPVGEVETQLAVAELALPEGEPIAALLDGMPVQRHPLLSGRLTVDDPDEWAEDYPARARMHGTAMASLITLGDLSSGASPIDSPLLVRPIMKPAAPGLDGVSVEHIPDNVLPTDLVRRAVVRLFEGEAGEDPVAPSVRIINLSVCDRMRPFARSMSAWARCLDWLSYRYGVLFVVSAGNCVVPIAVDIPKGTLATCVEQDRQDAFVAAIVRTWEDRRLLAPAESMNAITVGAIHWDASGDAALGRDACEPFPKDTRLPSPFGRIGLGYRRAIKPDVVNFGGRAVYTEAIAGGGSTALAQVRSSGRPPGQLVAAPSIGAARVAATTHSIGTSNAAALTTRAAIRLYADVVRHVLESPGRPPMGRRHQSVLLKSLLAHGAGWPSDAPEVARVLVSLGMDGRQVRSWSSRLFGFGVPDVERIALCTDQRASLIGWSDIEPEEGHRYRVPLPPSLSHRREHIRLTTTVGWFSPINARHQEYRRAAIGVEFPGLKPSAAFGATTDDVDHNATGRGTIYHQVFTGQRASVFGDDDYLEILVNCRPAAGGLEASVPYAIAVTLEVGEESDVPIYEEVRARVGVPVVVTA